MSRSPRKRPVAANLKNWRVVMMRNRGQLLGYVEARDLKSAEAAAVKAFYLDSEQRTRLLVQERD